GQMQGIKQRTEKSRELYHQIQQRRKEVQVKAAETQTNRAQTQAQNSQPRWETEAWNRGATPGNSAASADALEKQFQQWELNEELEELKRQMGR
ncbi:MAG: TIGR04376 family protein, partial [Oscillatoriales cyanobacterium RM1_1_9]|nr:TIGR04376 family protein [Oscillatoriales cyanobacterium RM1_1_9]